MEKTLREMGERGDIIKTMHRALTEQGIAHAAGDYEIHRDRLERRPVIGRLVGKGLAGDQLGDRMHLIIDGIPRSSRNIFRDTREAERDVVALDKAERAHVSGPKRATQLGQFLLQEANLILPHLVDEAVPDARRLKIEPVMNLPQGGVGYEAVDGEMNLMIDRPELLEVPDLLDRFSPWQEALDPLQSSRRVARGAKVADHLAEAKPEGINVPELAEIDAGDIRADTVLRLNQSLIFQPLERLPDRGSTDLEFHGKLGLDEECSRGIAKQADPLAQSAMNIQRLPARRRALSGSTLNSICGTLPC
jgi:hypothetical protein